MLCETGVDLKVYMIETFKNHIKFHKIFKKTKHLTINGTLEEILLNLKQYLG